jgi:hypothetical protein
LVFSFILVLTDDITGAVFMELSKWAFIAYMGGNAGEWFGKGIAHRSAAPLSMPQTNGKEQP